MPIYINSLLTHSSTYCRINSLHVVEYNQVEVFSMKLNQKISDSEMEIMVIIWSLKNPITSSQLTENLPKSKSWKPSTVLTFLVRLTEKGMLSITKKGKTNEYSALLSKEEYLRLETQNFLKSTHGGSIKSFIAALVESDISKEEIEELKNWFSKK